MTHQRLQTPRQYSTTPVIATSVYTLALTSNRDPADSSSAVRTACRT